MLRAHTVSVGILVDPATVYAFASDPANLPAWAPGFVKSIEQHKGYWTAQTTAGEVRMRFAPANTLGVIDHDVETPAGVVHNAVRVVPNDEGSEVLFTVLQRADVTDEQFAQDLAIVRADLNKLRTVLEHRAARSA